MKPKHKFKKGQVFKYKEKLIRIITSDYLYLGVYASSPDGNYYGCMSKSHSIKLWRNGCMELIKN